MLIIDAHAHVYSDDEKRYPPIDEPIRPPRESGSFSTWETLAKENKVAGVCIIQPASFYKWDNRFICDISRAFPKQTAVVCSLDPEDADSYESLKRYVREHGVLGLRSFAASDGHLEHPGVQALWKAAGEMGITINVFVDSTRTDELARMLERFPDQPVVIDHCLITSPGPTLNNMIENMLRLAKFPNSYAKLSFLPLGSSENYPFYDMHEPCKRIIANYGVDRCVWGSNFPCELWTPKATYADNLRLFTRELGLAEAARAVILGRTARKLWFRDKW